MAKFKCIENYGDFVEVLRDKEGRPALTVSDNHSASVAFFAPSDAPALCLAILEAAGVVAKPSNDDPGTPGNLGRIAYQLMIHIEDAENIAAAEADRVKLEAEALKFYNAHRAYSGIPPESSWDGYNETIKKSWLAVARAAREINKEDGQ